MKDKNPIDNVYFYSKRKPNEASAINDYQLSSFLPEKFNEELVRVYYKITDGNKEKEKKKVEEAEKCFQKWCKSKFGIQ
ncbi:deoxynucleoside triphosphate triphosphohydrolase SAMHD1-like [Onychostoma macrolepis]|nr:deoxynucleoside triphosphate triphosphohydrolase SAMHD1-like [Onychostoma macrolepis]